MEENRSVNPNLESVGSDLYIVTRYDPIWNVCDLSPVSRNQRGVINDVPLAHSFGGAWEQQFFLENVTANTMDPTQWGRCCRGPRWGQSVPVQVGDYAMVLYLSESQSNPVIVALYRWNGDMGIAWVANQVIGPRDNPYTSELPPDDDNIKDRYDVLLPSGAWIRSGPEGSWTIATPPVHSARAWISLFPDGKIKIKARDSKEDEYKIHVELDPNTQEGRIVVGKLDGGSWIRFKDGDIEINAQGHLQFFAQSADFSLADNGRLSPLEVAEGSANLSENDLIDFTALELGKQIIAGTEPADAILQINSPAAISDWGISPTLAYRVQQGIRRAKD